MSVAALIPAHKPLHQPIIQTRISRHTRLPTDPNDESIYALLIDEPEKKLVRRAKKDVPPVYRSAPFLSAATKAEAKDLDTPKTVPVTSTGLYMHAKRRSTGGEVNAKTQPKSNAISRTASQNEVTRTSVPPLHPPTRKQSSSRDLRSIPKTKRDAVIASPTVPSHILAPQRRAPKSSQPTRKPPHHLPPAAETTSLPSLPHHRDFVEDQQARLLTEQERSDILGGLRKNWNKLMGEYGRMPVVIDTLGKMRRKTQLEERIQAVEDDMRRFEGHNIIVR